MNKYGKNKNKKSLQNIITESKKEMIENINKVLRSIINHQ